MRKLILITSVSLCSAVVGGLITVFFLQQQLALIPLKTIPERPKLVNHVNSKPLATIDNFTATAKTTKRSVVNINAFKGEYKSANGSGVIISADGYIVTNHHLINGYSNIHITLADKREYKAILIGKDPETDLALLKIEGKNLPAIRLGDSDQLEIGAWVLAVGNPFNLTSTVTAGIVSAKSRDISILSKLPYAVESFIQTDAVVNPGSSGGALVNTSGELVGINSAIISESGGYEGFSFAIPSNLVVRIVNDLKVFGRVERAVLGVKIQDINNSQAQLFQMDRVEGIVIKEIQPNTTADLAGLQANDVITGINGKKVKTTPELMEQLARYRPGDFISIDYIRSGVPYRKNSVKLMSLKNDK